MAAVLESSYDLEVTLVEGHDGIYDVIIDDELVYSKRARSKEDALGEAQIVELVGRFLGVEPDQPAASEPQAGVR